MKKLLLYLPLSLMLSLLTTCDKDSNENISGKLTLHFNHLVDDHAIQFDQLLYTNAAGNLFEVTEIQWFISDVTLIDDKGQEFLLDENKFAHYVDTDLPETWTWEIQDKVKPGKYTAIRITFGLKGEKNIPYSFPNPPESDMLWPYTMGGDQGGYHYMKLNGFWINTDGQRTPYNVHLGVGQQYDGEDNVIAFIQNWFDIVLPQSSFDLHAGETKAVTVSMNIESWFETPHAYDFDVDGSKIMKNQQAMQKIKENGIDVFTCQFNSAP